MYVRSYLFCEDLFVPTWLDGTSFYPPDSQCSIPYHHGHVNLCLAVVNHRACRGRSSCDGIEGPFWPTRYFARVRRFLSIPSKKETLEVKKCKEKGYTLVESHHNCLEDIIQVIIVNDGGLVYLLVVFLIRLVSMNTRSLLNHNV